MCCFTDILCQNSHQVTVPELKQLQTGILTATGPASEQDRRDKEFFS